MRLSPGTQLRTYEIVSLIGAGGMGEVYRARDLRLKRDIAIKVLPDAWARDADRVMRFHREAEALATLNHPHIAAIYGFEEADGVKALLLELVEGQTLADRLRRGPLPLADVLSITRQLAEALDEAHRRGVVHRDLKPANIKVRDDGTVKVLDFGLAKALDVHSSADDRADAATETNMATRAGAILGTAAYMSPEQARGQNVVSGTDIWALGCVLWEMLTGRLPFAGGSVTDTLAAVLTREPDWTALPVSLPTVVRVLLTGCLEKDRHRRLRDASTILFVLDKLSDTGHVAPAASKRGSRMGAVAATLVVSALLAGASGAWLARRGTLQVARPLSRFEIVPTSPQLFKISSFDRDLAISPDGRHIAFVGVGSPNLLFIRHLDALETATAATLTATTNPVSTFFSPDSAFLGFFDGTVLKRVPAAGGPAATICSIPGLARGASWRPDGTIVFATSSPETGLFTVAASGGDPRRLTTPDATQGESDHLFPTWLPDGRHVVFTITSADQRREHDRVAVFDATTGQYATLIRGASHAEYVEGGYLLYASASTLFAVRFDPEKLAVAGDPVAVLEHVNAASTGAVDFTVSSTGTLVYVPEAASAQRSLLWVDRQGRETPIAAPPRAYTYPRLSPDGTRVAVDVRDQDNDIWIWDLVRETLTRFTYGAEHEHHPIWGPGGRDLIFGSRRPLPNGAIYRRPADGSREPEAMFALESRYQWPTSLSPDGSTLVVERSLGTGSEIGTQRLSTASAGTVGTMDVSYLLQTGDVYNGEISPDGRWLAYQANQSQQFGRFEVYVSPYPNVAAGRWQVSLDGGVKPAWARTGRELFFMSNGKLMSAAIPASGPAFHAAKPVTVVDRPYFSVATDVLGGYTMGRTYDVSADGQRFLMVKEDPDERAPAKMVLVLNWIDELPRLVH